MMLIVFARFHARPGCEAEVASALRGQLGPVRAEAGWKAIEAYRSTRDPRLFFLHSRSVDEVAFELHASLPHTTRFLEVVRELIDHPLDVTRTRVLEQA